MNKKLLWIIIGIVVLLVAMIGLKAAGVFGKDVGTKAIIEAAAKRTIIETVNASGKIYPEIEVKVSPDISGEIVELKVNEGDSVFRGQVVAKIYADIYLSQRDQVAAGVAQAQAQFENVNLSLGALKATLDQAETNYNRQKKLLDEKVISKAEFEQAQQSYISAKANYNAAKEGLKTNKAGIQSAQAQLQRADKDLSRTTIISPMNGVVSLLSVKKGERVAGNSFNVGTEMMRIADMNSIVAQVDVGENDIPKVKIGDTALITVDAYNNRKFKGLVYKIANPSTGLGVTGTTDVTNYKVHIRLLKETYSDLITKGRFPFRPGMSASTEIQTRREIDVLSVPLNAVTTRDVKEGKPSKANTDDIEKEKSNNNDKQTVVNEELEEVVFVYDKATTKVKKVKVKTAIQDLNYIQIVNGLKEGDEVVTGPYNLVSKLLKEGDKVLKTDKDKLFEDKKN
ncbi:MAG: efflux RND transporter periplasmic adaptor subunit [Chitinophagaceae bacterium]|nr:efflux RND transporter periplasmic adaptor subunit [Chitinophagaceae bacterium]